MKDDFLYIDHILQSINSILEYTKDLTRKDFSKNKLVQDAVIKLMENRTTIIIAHRLSTIKHVNRIYVMSEGIMVEEGSHLDLVTRDKGIYATLADLQLK